MNFGWFFFPLMAFIICNLILNPSFIYLIVCVFWALGSHFRWLFTRSLSRIPVFSVRHSCLYSLHINFLKMAMENSRINRRGYVVRLLIEIISGFMFL